MHAPVSVRLIFTHSLVCEVAVYVHVTSKCEAITGFDRVKSSGGIDDVLFLSSYGVTTEF